MGDKGSSCGQWVLAILAIIAVVTAIVALVLIIAIAIAYSGTLNNLQTEINQLASDINSTSTTVLGLSQNGNLTLGRGFSSCTQERSSCSIGTGTNSYFLHCETSPALSAIELGAYTVDIRCEYSSNAGFFVSTHVQRARNDVFCFCDLINPNPSTGALQLIPTTTTFTCDLIIDRCPLGAP